MSTAKEGRLRKLHRRDWPGFLTRMIPPSVWRAVSQGPGNDEDSRIRWTVKYIVLAYVAMGWSQAHCLTDRFKEAYALLAALFPRRHRPGKTYVGLTKAGMRLGWSAFRRFWACLRDTIPDRIGEAWRWHGWVVFAVDGSREDTTRTRANERALGRSGRDKTHPQWWMTWLVHLPTLLLWDWQQGPGNSSEREHLRAMLGSLPADALLVGDVGFGGFDFLRTVAQSKVHFLVRCASNTTLLVEGTYQRIRRCGDVRFVWLWPSDQRRHPPLQLRLIMLRRRKQTVCLVTNVFEPQRLSRAAAGELYRARWGIEVNYRSFKRTMERCKVLARTPDPGSVELAGNILAMGLLRLHAAIAQGANMSRMSVASVLRVIRRAIEAVRFGRSTTWLWAALRAAVQDRHRRRKSKRARDWPDKKRESPPNPPRLRRLTKREKARIHGKTTKAAA